jgi:prevent-host-death family protein
MITVSITEMRRRWDELTRRVENGETVVVTRYGRPVVNLIPHRPQNAALIKSG